MKIIKTFIILLFLNSSFFLYAQKGKNGVGNITTANTVVNEYYAVTSKLNAGVTNINVNNTLQAGDLILIIEMQGVLLQPGPIYSNGYSDAPNMNINIGHIVNYNSVGLYEFKEVLSASPTSITISCPLINSYDYNYTFKSDCDVNEGINMTCTISTTAKVQVVKVPRYSSLTVTATGSITANAWNGTVGGIVAIESQGNITINGIINASANGFRGGDPMNSGTWDNIYNYWITKPECGGMKGEGIGGWVTEYDGYGGRYGRGVGANGGGGGDAHNAGGGGGANAGDTSKWVDGVGNPDLTYNSSWMLETPSIAGLSRSGGGRGGYGWATATLDPTVVGPDNNNWGGNGRKNVGGFGGRPLDYTTGRIFMGGGGGAGHGDQNLISAGGKGGGIVFIFSYGAVNGSGSIISDGQNGGDMKCPNGQTIDVGSGAGAGGTIMINASKGVAGVSLSAQGGKGGNQPICPNASDHNETEGGAGGGGGGFIAITTSNIIPNVSGGKNGITYVAAMSKFPPNGATSGGNGISTITTIKEDSICPGDQASLSVSNIVSDPKGTNTCWYQNATGGSSLATGLTYSPVLSDSTTFWVGICSSCSQIELPRIPVKVYKKKNCGFTVSLKTSPDSICNKDKTTLSLTVNGGSGSYSYQWDNSLIGSGPFLVNPTINTTYHVTVTDQHTLLKDSAKATVFVTTILMKDSTSICSDDPPLNLSTAGIGFPAGGIYSGIGINNGIFDPSIAGTGSFKIIYILNKCVDTSIITVKTCKIKLKITASPDTICSGSQSILSATVTGATEPTTYQWDNISTNINTQTVSPLKTTTYYLTVTDAIPYQTSAEIVVVVDSSALNPFANNCVTDASYTLTGGTPTGGKYKVDGTISSTFNPAVAGVGTHNIIYLSPAAGCISTQVIHVTSSPPAKITGNTSVCSGGSVTLTASGGKSYSWSENNLTTTLFTVTPQSSKKYTVTVTDSVNCKATDTLTINVTPPPDNPHVDDVSLCSNNPVQDVTLSIGSPRSDYVYRWFDAPSNGNMLYQGNTFKVNQVTSPHTYYMETISSDSCHSSSREVVTISINNPPVASFDYQPKPIVMQNAPVEFFNLSSSDATKFNWSFGKDQSSLTKKNPYYIYSDTGLFTITLTAINDFKCQSDTSMEIYVKKRLAIWLPEVFTPNNDGKNDIFYVRGPIKTMRMEIYNQWGFRIFFSEKQSDGWDGKFQGIEQPEGNYVWTIDATTTDEQQVKQQGEITLIR